ncbi:uncharacterized protein LOC133284433 [Gastrolobium bilobum]|uniref:uncharacterized protein LOC133284433 n=1 Tax=Gastrolobium bilobum TaxID=150636 RepID=UPI002AB25435|nr:uncharacterized protein LOC133284433 [Gastrolobium bilobum]
MLMLTASFLKETEDQAIQKDSTSDKTVTTTLSTDSETRNTSLGPLLAPLEKALPCYAYYLFQWKYAPHLNINFDFLQCIKKTVEEGTTSVNVKTITSSTHSKSEDDNGQIATPSFSGVTAEPPTTKDVDVRDSQETSELEIALTKTHALESKHSPSFFSIESQSPSVPFKGNSSQIKEDLNFASLVTWELEQLVSNKHLDHDNLSLLTDFLVKHPSVRLNDKALSNWLKGCAYNRLSHLLRFLQTHSPNDVLGSNRSEFMELLQDVRRFGFDKDWLNGVERRALFPGLQISQDALQKVLDSKRNLIQHVEDLKLQLASFDSVLESIIQQEAQVLEAGADLSFPIGY